ncbi:hypothetical protein ABZ446_44880 [Streptomyces sp. NPDC005813]|uniref:InlB B-repeat-containing protein n=1 Tax=Streptomyces sp. NPDC005813 TaxID=3155592 RepID=UPI0033CC8208
MGVRRLAAVAVAALMMLGGAAMPVQAAASPCPMPGGFETDGDLQAATCTPSGDDWDTPGLNVGSTTDGGSYQTVAKDDSNPATWTSSGSTPDQSVFSGAFAAARVVDGHYYVYAAWERGLTSGTQSYAIEIDNAPANAPGGTPQPNRSSGGAVFYLSSQGSAPPIVDEACSFTSQSNYGTTCTSSSTSFTGAINTASTTDVFSGQTLPAGSFFEVVLDVTALTGIAPSCPGSSAASLYLRSITGQTHNGNLKGYLQPITIQPNTTCVSAPMTTTATPGGSANSPDTVQHDDVSVGTEDAPGVGTVRFYLCSPPVVTANGGDCSRDGTLVSTSMLDASGRASSATAGGEGGAVGTSCWRAEFTPSADDHHYLPAQHTNATTECFTIAPAHTLTVTKTGSGTGTVTSTPPGISCGATCSHAFTDRTAVTLAATPDSGSNFAGWSGACSGTGTCTVTMDADQTVTAAFTAGPPPVGPPDTTIRNALVLRRAHLAVFTFTGSRGVGPLRFLCRLDNAPFTACRSPQLYTRLTTGGHTFQVEAVDSRGQADPTPATQNFSI